MFLPDLWRFVWRLQTRLSPSGWRRLAQSLVRLRPGDPHLWIVLHAAIQRQGTLQEAREVITLARDRHPENEELLLIAAHHAFWNEDDDSVLRLSERAASLHPDSPLPHLFIGNESARRMNFEEMRRHCYEAHRKLSNRDGISPVLTPLLWSVPLAWTDAEMSRDLLLWVLHHAFIYEAAPIYLRVILDELGDSTHEQDFALAMSAWKGSLDEFRAEEESSRNILRNPRG